MHLVCRHRATRLDDHGPWWARKAPLTCANARIDASRRVRERNGALLITQRSQVQILPPLQVRQQVSVLETLGVSLGLVKIRGRLASCRGSGGRRVVGGDW